MKGSDVIGAICMICWRVCWMLHSVRLLGLGLGSHVEIYMLLCLDLICTPLTTLFTNILEKRAKTHGTNNCLVFRILITALAAALFVDAAIPFFFNFDRRELYTSKALVVDLVQLASIGQTMLSLSHLYKGYYLVFLPILPGLVLTSSTKVLANEDPLVYRSVVGLAILLVFLCALRAYLLTKDDATAADQTLNTTLLPSSDQDQDHV